jgi:type I restriction enzyme S subunit
MNASRIAERGASYALQTALEPTFGTSFDLLAAAPQGVAKLRELILSLAVQGKLIRQDRSDEPAVFLLRKIAKKAGRTHTSTPTDQLHEGWAATTFGEYALALCTGPFGSLIGKDEYIEGGIPLVNPSHMKNGRIEAQAGISVSTAKANELKAYALQSGDIVFARRGDVGRTAVVSDKEDGWLCGTGSFFARFHPDVDRAFIQMIFNSAVMRSYLSAAAIGTTMVNLNQRVLLNAPLDIPPLAEQARIVARVEELMQLCDALEVHGRLQDEQHARLVATLFDALAASASAEELAENWQRIASHFDLLLDRPEAVDALEQTLLQLAVRGLLVPQDESDEPASKLLDRIRAEKGQLVAEGKVGRDMPLPQVADDEAPFVVPAAWQWVRFGALVRKSEAGWSPSCEGGSRRGDAWGVLKVSAVSWGEFRSSENKQLPASLKPRPEYEVQSGDFLISRANTEELVARSVVAKNPEPRLMLSDKIIRLDISSLVDRDFLNMVNNAKTSRTYYAENASGTSSSMKNVGRQVILNLPIPLPPLAEQHRIVARFEQLRRLCADLRERLQQARATQSRLAEALVSAAAESPSC